MWGGVVGIFLSRAGEPLDNYDNVMKVGSVQTLHYATILKPLRPLHNLRQAMCPCGSAYAVARGPDRAVQECTARTAQDYGQHGRDG